MNALRVYVWSDDADVIAGCVEALAPRGHDVNAGTTPHKTAVDVVVVDDPDHLADVIGVRAVLISDTASSTARAEVVPAHPFDAATLVAAVERAPATKDDDLEGTLRALRQRFERDVPNRVAAIVALLQHLEAKPDDDASIEAAFRAAHALYGTAGSYGLAELSAACRRVELALRHRSEKGEHTTSDEAARLRAILDRPWLTASSTQPPASTSASTSVALPSVLVISADDAVAESVGNAGFSVTHVRAAELPTSATPWSAVVVDIRGLVGGTTALRAQHRHVSPPPPLAVVGVSGAAEEAEACFVGADLVVGVDVDLAVALRLLPSLSTKSRADGASLDALTRLPTRQEFMRRVVDIERGVVVIVDVCDLGRVNRDHGDSAGDAALAEVASALRLCGRRCDLRGRLAGDRFVVAFDGVDVGVAERVVASLAEELAATRFVPERHAPPFTLRFRSAVAAFVRDAALQVADLEQSLTRQKRGA